VASYGAVIEISVRGQEALNKLEGSARRVESLIQNIKQQRNIFDQSIGTEQTRNLKRNLENLVGSFALAKEGARQFKITLDGKERTINMYSKTLAGLNQQLNTFESIANNATVGTEQYRYAITAANKVANEFARTQAKAASESTKLSAANVGEALALGKVIPDSIEGLNLYLRVLEDLLTKVKLGSNEFRVLEDVIASINQRLSNARLTGQVSKITPTSGPATRLDTVEFLTAAYQKRASFAKAVADQEYKLLTAGQQIVQAKLKETQQEELQNRLAQASEALARGELDIAKRLTNEIRNQRIAYANANKAQEALMRPTSMVAGPAESVTGRRPGGLPPVPGSRAAWQATGGVQEPPRTPSTKTKIDNQLASQKRLNYLLNSAQIIEQKIIQLKARGVNLSSQERAIESIINGIQQNSSTITEEYLSTLNDVLNSLRNELKLEKEILATQEKQAKAEKSSAKKAKSGDGKNSKLKEAIGNAIIGGAFPLLFGQGLGAAAGGGIGGFGGGLLGGNFGFGLSLVGTAVGTQLDAAVQRATELGQALLKPTENIDKIIDALGIANTALGSSISILRELGFESTAASVAVEELEAKLGVKTVDSIRTLGAEFTEFQNALATLSVRLTAFLSGPLSSFIELLTSVVGSISNAEAARQVSAGLTGERRKAFEADLARLTGGAGFSGTISDAALQELTRKYDPVQVKAQEDAAKARERAENIIVQYMERQLTLAQNTVNVEAGRLSARRDTLAADQKSLDIQKIANDLEQKRTEFINEQQSSKRRILNFELQILDKQKLQAEAERRNAVIEAQRQITRDVGNLRIEQADLENQISDIRTKNVELSKGEEAGIINAYNALEKKVDNELGILYIRRDLEKLGVNEIEVLQEIQTKYDGLAAVARDRYKNEKLILEQQYAQYQLTQLQIKQQQAQQVRQATTQAQLQIGQLMSFQDPTGIGIFGDALLNQKLALQEYTATLAEYNSQLLAIEERQKIQDLNPDVALRLEQEAQALRNQIAVYKEYQPAIIQARLEQERFNVILGYTEVAVASITDNLLGVVAGTVTAQEAFANFLNTIADMLAEAAQRIIAQYIAIGIARIFAGMGSASGATSLPGAAPQMTPGAIVTPSGFSGQFAGLAAKGAYFNNGIAKFARGGVVSSPMLFPFANGGTTRMGLMGEAGPEAIMPLRRGADGRLGVEASGGGSMNVIVNVDAKGTSVQGNDQSGNQLGRAIAAAVQAELVKQKRPGGLLTT
jgi:hypothetical protein